jgi:predicted RNA-binding Zn ribbon-like protein
LYSSAIRKPLNIVLDGYTVGAVPDTVPPLPRRLGGRLCLDFVNTIEARASDQPEELLVSPARLVDWARDAGALRDAPSRPADAALLREAITLREALHRVLLEQYTAGDLSRVNHAIAEAGRHSIVVPEADGYAWGWSDDAPASLLWEVARDMAALLTDREDLARVRTCGLDDCGWLFVDQSRNHSRRWCSMEGCGNIAKARAFQARRRASGQERR